MHDVEAANRENVFALSHNTRSRNCSVVDLEQTKGGGSLLNLLAEVTAPESGLFIIGH